MRTLKLVAGAVLAMILVAIGTANAGFDNAGTTAGNFLSLGTGARTLGMGGATLGLADDVGGAAWNAAALGWLSGPEVVLSHASLQSKSLQEWGGIGGRIARSRTTWAVAGHYQGEGTFEGLDASGAPTGTFSASSMALGATVAQQLGKYVTVGGGAKAVREKLADVAGSGVTFDAGMMVRAGMFGFGMAGQNMGGHMTYGSSTYPFPTNYGVGVALVHRATGLRLAIDANFPSAYHSDVRAGAEWTYRGTMALRSGYRHELGSSGDPLSGATFGLGAGHGAMWVDYGYLLSGNGPGQHRVGLRFKLGTSGSDDGALGQRSGGSDFDATNATTAVGAPPKKQP